MISEEVPIVHMNTENFQRKSSTILTEKFVPPFFSGSPFSTKDNDSSEICAQLYKGAWWYKDCHESNLNGLYLRGAYSSDADGVCWKAFRGWQYSPKRTEMKVK